MANTGYKAWATLEKYNIKTGMATGETKPNVSGTEGYVAPVYDVSMCPIPDTTAPVISTLNGEGVDEVSIRLYWTVSDNVGIASQTILFKRAGESVYTIDNRIVGTDGTQDIDWNPPFGDDPGTTYTIYIRVYDEAGNYADSNTVTVSTIVPTDLIISPTSKVHTASGGSFTVTITSNTDWIITDNATWISTSKTSGTGNDSFSVTLSNNTSVQRTGSVTVKSANNLVTRTLDITQEAATNLVSDYLAYNEFASSCGMNPSVNIWHDGVGLGGFPDFSMATNIYSNNTGTTFAPAGYYSDGIITKRWTGSSFVTTTYC